MSVTVVPSLPAASLREIESLTAALSGVASGIQIDIVDGVYVPHRSWPFTEDEGMRIWPLLAPVVEGFALEVDCMVEQPEQYLDQIAALAPERVCIHVGSTTQYDQIIAHAFIHGYKLGLAFTNDTPLDALDEYAEDIFYVQLMGITEVGQQGQPFDERTLARAREISDRYPALEIAVDGAVNADTMPALYAAGVTRFAPGSAVTKAEDPAAAYKQLVALVS